MKNEILSAMSERRSIKNYLPKQIEEEKLEAILEAGLYAANGRGLQSPIMVVVQDPTEREILRRMNATILGSPASDPFYGAPTVIVVLADRAASTAIEDGSLVMGNIMLAAHSLGIDSCWIHRARQEFDSDEGRALLRKWGVDGDYVGVGHCILGYSGGARPAAKPRKENRIYRV